MPMFFYFFWKAIECKSVNQNIYIFLIFQKLIFIKYTYFACITFFFIHRSKSGKYLISCELCEICPTRNTNCDVDFGCKILSWPQFNFYLHHDLATDRKYQTINFPHSYCNMKLSLRVRSAEKLRQNCCTNIKTITTFKNQQLLRRKLNFITHP